MENCICNSFYLEKNHGFVEAYVPLKKNLIENLRAKGKPYEYYAILWKKGLSSVHENCIINTIPAEMWCIYSVCLTSP